jgi:hypothetical protein
MSRLAVEGWSEGQVNGSFPNPQVAQVILEGSADPEVAYRVAGGAKPSVVHDASAAVIFNADPITVHTYKFFVRGTDIPGGEVEITALYTLLLANSIAALGSEPWPSFMPLLEGQSLEVEQQQVNVTTAPKFVAVFRDVVASQNDITVSGKRVTQVCEVIPTGTPYRILGPVAGDDFSMRQMLWTYTNSQNCLSLFNPSGNTADVTVTLHTADGDTVIFADPAVLAGAQIILPLVMTLREDEYIEIATGDEDLVLLGSVTDYV